MIVSKACVDNQVNTMLIRYKPPATDGGAGMILSTYRDRNEMVANLQTIFHYVSLKQRTFSYFDFKKSTEIWWQ